jgi:hypothetical protein
MPTKNFFPLLLAPTRSSFYPFLYTSRKCFDRYVIKLPTFELSPFLQLDLHVIKLQLCPDST